MGPSHIIQISPQGGNFLVSSSLILPDPVSKVGGVFSNRSLLSSSWLRAITIAYIMLGLSWIYSSIL